MTMSERDLLLKKLEREQKARLEAESLLETKSSELFFAAEQLRILNDSLEEQVRIRTEELTKSLVHNHFVAEQQRRAESRFRATIESAPAAMVMVDIEGRIVLANTEAHRMFDFQPGELLGQIVEILIPERFRGQHGGMRRAFFEAPQTRRMGAGRDLFGLRRDGTEFPIEIGLNPVETEEGMYVLSAIVDITERKQAQAVLDQTRRDLEDLAENSNVPMHWVNQNGVLEWANQAELNLLGYSREEYIGQPIAKFHVDREAIEDILCRLVNCETLSGYEARLRAKDGKIKVVSIHSSVYLQDGEFKHTRCFTTDITDKKLAEARLEDHARQLEQSNRELEQFAYVASHDLKSPLRAILHLAQWIAEDTDNKLSDQSREDLASLQTRSVAMSRLLDDLLTYSRVGHKAYERIEVDTRQLIADIVTSLHKPAEFEVVISGPMPTLITPLVPLRLVLQNLIENAIKHHDRTDGRVEVSAREVGNFLEFVVQDDGPGIPVDAVGKVFELFVTLGRREKTDSSGMGLALVKKTVESYGGSVSIETPASNTGVIFRVRWPGKQTDA